MKNSKVRVTADPSGSVIVVSKKNPDYGHIRLEQDRIIVDDRGFARKKAITALVVGLISDLKSFGWQKGQEIEGKIIAKEQLTPFNSNPEEAERDYKIAGKTAVVCCLDGEPIYRKTFFTFNEQAEDVLLAHNNGEAIKAAYAALKVQETEENL